MRCKLITSRVFARSQLHCERDARFAKQIELHLNKEFIFLRTLQGPSESAFSAFTPHWRSAQVSASNFETVRQVGSEIAR